MRAHLVQLDIAWEDRAANFRRVTDLISTAGISDGDLIVLPEMFDSGFSLNTEITADTRGETAAFLSNLAKDSRATVHAGTTAIGPDGRGRNRARTFGPRGEAISDYDKMHPFTYGREGERFSRGDRVHVWELPSTGNLVCSTVCYDLRFPELFRTGLTLGASIFTVVANWPAGRREHWRALCIARAIENQAVVLGVNRCGRDPHLTYLGGSLAVDAQGHVLAEGDEREQVLSFELDLPRIARWRQEFPAWRDQHPSLWPPGKAN